MNPTPNQIRFTVEPRLVPPTKAARRLHLTISEFNEKIGALLRAGMPAPCSVTGHYDLVALDAWLDRRAGVQNEEYERARHEAEMQVRFDKWKRELDAEPQRKRKGMP